MALTHSRTRFTSSLPLSIPKARVNAFLSPNYEALLLAEIGLECPRNGRQNGIVELETILVLRCDQSKGSDSGNMKGKKQTPE